MILQYSSKVGMFGGFNKNSFFDDPVNNTEKRSIFGNEIPQNAKAKPDISSSACCALGAGPIPSGGFKMNSFYSTIWSKNMRNVLISTMAMGEEHCCIEQEG